MTQDYVYPKGCFSALVCDMCNEGYDLIPNFQCEDCGKALCDDCSGDTHYTEFGEYIGNFCKGCE